MNVSERLGDIMREKVSSAIYVLRRELGNDWCHLRGVDIALRLRKQRRNLVLAGHDVAQTNRRRGKIARRELEDGVGHDVVVETRTPLPHGKIPFVKKTLAD